MHRLLFLVASIINNNVERIETPDLTKTERFLQLTQEWKRLYTNKPTELREKISWLKRTIAEDSATLPIHDELPCKQKYVELWVNNSDFNTSMYEILSTCNYQNLNAHDKIKTATINRSLYWQHIGIPAAEKALHEIT